MVWTKDLKTIFLGEISSNQENLPADIRRAPSTDIGGNHVAEVVVNGILRIRIIRLVL